MIAFKFLTFMLCLSLLVVKTVKLLAIMLVKIGKVMVRIIRLRRRRGLRGRSSLFLVPLLFCFAVTCFAGTAPSVAVDSSVYSRFRSDERGELVAVYVKYVPTGGLSTVQRITDLKLVNDVPANYTFRTQSSGFYDYSVETSARDVAYYVFDPGSDTLYFSYQSPASKFVQLLTGAFASELFDLDTEVKRLRKADELNGRVITPLIVFPSLGFSVLLGDYVTVVEILGASIVVLFIIWWLVRRFLASGDRSK